MGQWMPGSRVLQDGSRFVPLAAAALLVSP